MSSCVIVGVAGASGSGKTRLASELCARLKEDFGEESAAVICEDFYYKDQSNILMEERVHTNYDHPNALDHTLLIEQIEQLKSGKSVELPQYDYTQHTRSDDTVSMRPTRVIIVEGILLFSDAELRKHLDYLIFVDTPLDVCFIRRARRDMEERGRTFENIIQQYEATVRPMYLAFIEPSRVWADIIVPSWKDNTTAVKMIKSQISEHLR